MIYKIFIIFLLLNLSNCSLFEFSKYPENFQPTGTTNYDIILKFEKIYKSHTYFTLEKKEKNPTFGEIFSFSPLSHCDNEYNKNLAIQCLQNKPSSWWWS